MESTSTSTWHLIVPVKHTDRGKSRLRTPGGIARSDLALAIALDTVSAILQVVPAGRVIVVTSDPEVDRQLGALGVTVVPDPGRGLNPALLAGIDSVGASTPAGPAGLLLGDLPALDGAELARGLAACAACESALVPDREGTGTVLLTHHDAKRLAPRFGAGSAARHARTATRLDLDLPRLRTDVDDAVSLQAAIELGVGPWTRRLLPSESGVPDLEHTDRPVAAP